jgi:serine/threonine-protein phosphatase 2A activator
VTNIYRFDSYTERVRIVGFKRCISAQRTLALDDKCQEIWILEQLQSIAQSEAAALIPKQLVTASLHRAHSCFNFETYHLLCYLTSFCAFIMNHDKVAKLPSLTPRKKLPRDEESSQSEPPPTTLDLPPPPDTSRWHFFKPSRRILSKQDHDVFLGSSTYTLITSFIFTLSDCVRDIPVSAIRSENPGPTIAAILKVLDEIDELLQKYPPEDSGGSRFGNKTFQKFFDEVAAMQSKWHAYIGLKEQSAIEEVSTYLVNAFGNRARIDYGSGHELNFFMWLLCLNRLNLMPYDTFRSIILIVFPRYLRLMRNVQTTYYLEPAGSHGVWGLDDYQFLPFLFGASQLYNHRHIRPKSIHQAMILEEFGKEYLYLDQVNFVNSVKNVEGLRWHSPMLDDISAAKSWAKIEGGMRKMFIKEVLGKLPVMQHFLFGSLIPAVDSMSTDEQIGKGMEMGEIEDGQELVTHGGMQHTHAENSWGDCCGIKVPSSIGAAQELKKHGGADGLRRIPFD